MSIDVIINKEKYSVENTIEKIIGLLCEYEYSEVMKLFAYTNIKLNSEAAKSSGYMVSPKLTRNIPFIYITKASSGHKKIDNIDQLFEKYSNLLDELSKCYTNIVDFITKQDSFHKSYISYHFDFPTISIRQYFNFFFTNREILGKIYNVKNEDVVKLIHTLFLLITFERSWNKNFKSSPYANFLKWRNINNMLNYEGLSIYYQIPINMIKKIFKKYKIYDLDIIDKLFLNTTNIVKTNKVIYPTEVKKLYPQYFGLRNNSFIVFMRNFNVLNSIYEFILSSKEFNDHNKGIYLERRTQLLLEYVFGKNNVFYKVYDEYGAENDFIILYQENIISVECKATRFAEPFFDQKKAHKRLVQNFKKTIQKAYDQSERIVKNFDNGKMKFYDSDKKEKRNEVLDLSNFNFDKFQSIVVTLEKYHTLGTELQISIEQTKYINLPLVIDINSFEILLNKCTLSYNTAKFIEYLDRRSEFYGFVYPSNADELDCFGYFLNYGNIIKDSVTGLSIIIGSGYSSFVTDFLEIDNYMIFNELYGI